MLHGSSFWIVHMQEVAYEQQIWVALAKNNFPLRVTKECIHIFKRKTKSHFRVILDQQKQHTAKRPQLKHFVFFDWAHCSYPMISF